MTQTVRMYVYPESQTAEIILSVCKIGNYMTAGSSSRMVLSVSDCPNIRGLAAALAKFKENDPTACLSLWLGGVKHKFDMSLWPEILVCLEDFFAMVDGQIDPFFDQTLIIEEDDPDQD